MRGKLNGEKDKGFRAVLSDRCGEDSVPLQGKAFDLVICLRSHHWS